MCDSCHGSSAVLVLDKWSRAELKVDLKPYIYVHFQSSVCHKSYIYSMEYDNMPCTKALREIHIMGSKAFQETTVCINFQKLEHGTYRSGRVSHQFLRQLGSAMKRGHQTMDFPINHFRQTHIILRSVDDGVPEMKTPHPPYIWADYIKFGAIARPHFVTKNRYRYQIASIMQVFIQIS